MGYTLSFIVLGCLAAIINKGDAVHGPEIEVPASEMSNFVNIAVPLGEFQLPGIILSKKYFASFFVIGMVPVEFFEIRFGDLSTAPVLPLVALYATEGTYYAVGKVCGGMNGKPVSINPSSFPDTTQNRTADYYYARLGENKYYKRSIDLLADDSCEADQTGTRNEGGTFNFEFEACIAHDKSPGTCTAFYDQDWRAGAETLPWVVYNKQPLGFAFSTSCVGEADIANGTESYMKLSKGREGIMMLTPPGGVSLP